MAISPTVSAWMQNAQGAQGQPADAETLFKKALQEHAFNSLRAKAPELLPHVVTFKCLECDVDTGNAFGAFAISSGSDLAFVPVVMSAGSIVSCEMLYLRDEDQFVPLSGDFITKVVSRSASEIARPLKGNVRVEDTRRMFRNIIRPPASSNVVLASERIDISKLPDGAKAKIAAYFNDNPAVLAKVAEFYPVSVLAERLAPSGTSQAKHAEAKVLSVSSISAEEAAYLHPSEKKAMLERGWILKGAAAETKTALDPTTFGAETEARLSEYNYRDRKHSAVCVGDILTFTDGSVKYTPVALFGRSSDRAERDGTGDKAHRHYSYDRDMIEPVTVVNKDGGSIRVGGTCSNEIGNSLVLRDKRLATEADLITLGFTDVSGVKEQLRKTIADCKGDDSFRSWYCVVAVPRKHGCLGYAACFELDKYTSIVEGDDDAWSARDRDGKILFTATPRLTYGCVVENRGPYARGLVTLPRTALFRVIKNPYQSGGAFSGLIGTLQQLFDLIKKTGISLRVRRNDGGVNITDLNTQKTAEFVNDAGAAEWLHSNYNLTEPQIVGTLGRENTLLITKLAAGVMGGGAAPMSPQSMAARPQPVPQAPMAPQPVVPQPAAPQSVTPQLLPQGNVQVPVSSFDPSAIPAFIGTGDQDMVDVGILASFAGDPDVKGLLVDYLPDFLSVMDRLGRVILLFCLQRQELEQYYRVDRINELLQNCRKVFRLVGDLVQSLKLYVNMA